jgi:hypothetical protein
VRRWLGLIAVAAGLGSCSGARPSNHIRSHIPVADPGGYPVECSRTTTTCYQFGGRVQLLESSKSGLLIDAAAAALCTDYSYGHGDPKGGFTWQPIGDPAPGVGPDADTYVCGPPGVSLYR